MKSTQTRFVIRRDIETGETSKLTMADAIKKLSNYWKPETIEGMLVDGLELFTPYSVYQIDNTVKKYEIRQAMYCYVDFFSVYLNGEFVKNFAYRRNAEKFVERNS